MKKMRMMIALALAVVMLLCMTGCGQDKTPESLEDLIQLVDELNNEIEDLKERVAVLEQKGGLTKWELTPEVWSSNNGATISLSATPENYQAGQTAVFSVRLGDVEVANVVCAWDGKVYTAEVDLEAADVNGDGNINYLDAYLIMNYSVGNIETFPVEESSTEEN